jgi:hypothetical protein
MVKRFLPFLLLAGAFALEAQISVGVRIGPPPPPRVVAVRPAAPGPDYVWVDGYWYAANGRWVWHDGYWTRAPYAGARWVGPRYENGMFISGYWEGEHGRFEHRHDWDRERDRDWNRWHDDHR